MPGAQICRDVTERLQQKKKADPHLFDKTSKFEEGARIVTADNYQVFVEAQLIQFHCQFNLMGLKQDDLKYVRNSQVPSETEVFDYVKYVVLNSRME